MVNLDFDNPFADYGGIVFGDRFIGRKNDLRVIENRVIRPKEAGNLAIIGEPRIGKSSLVYQGIMQRKDELANQKILPIWINLATYDQPSTFFRELVRQCVDEIEDLDLLSKTIESSSHRALEERLSWNEGYSRIQRFFAKVRKAGYRVIFILDEFDAARILFKANITGFQGLRELSYRPEWRVNFITTSRRSIREIELQSGAISTLDGIFQKHYLGTFADEDLQQFFTRFLSIGISPSDVEKDRIFFYCDSHPYLLDMLGYEIVELFREQQKVNVEKAARQSEGSFLDYYDIIVKLLQEENRLNKLIEILFGPVDSVKQEDVNEFLQYGLIKQLPNENYVGFSRHFQDFIKLVERETQLGELGAIFRATETGLRALITTTLINRYGEGWIDLIERTFPDLKDIFYRCRQEQKEEEALFGSRASQNLIEFTQPKQLFEIIFAEWNTFEPIFGEDEEYWRQRSQLLTKIRKPLAENRDRSLYKHQRKIAEAYCQEIIAILDREQSP